MTPTTNDRGFDRSLETYIAWRSSQSGAAPDVATMTARVAAGVGLADRGTPAVRLRPSLLAVALTLIGVLAVSLGLALVGGLGPDLPQAEVPPAIASPTSSLGRVSPAPIATDAPDPPAQTVSLVAEPFTSATYGYRIRPPEGWNATPATIDWRGGDLTPQVADTFEPIGAPARRLTIAGSWSPASVEWPPPYVPPAFKIDGTRRLCVLETTAGTFRSEDTEQLTEGRIDGRHADIWSFCGRVTARVQIGPWTYHISLFAGPVVDRDGSVRSPVVLNGDRGLFDAIAATIDFDPRAEQVAFTSPQGGYTVVAPAGWTSQPDATYPAERDAMWLDGPGGVRFRVVPHPLADGLDEAWLARTVPKVDAESGRGCRWQGAGMDLTASARWSRTVIAGQPGWRRALCGEVQGVVVLGDRAFLLWYMGSVRRPDGDTYAFTQLAETLAIATAGSAAPRYGYTIDVPDGWRAVVATEPWRGDGRPVVSAADTFVGPTVEGSPRLTVAARSKPDETSEDRFIADVAPLPDKVRLDGPDVRCAFGSAFVERGPITAAWPIEVIGGHRARLRAMCGTVDAIVFVGGRGYLFTLESGEQTTGDLERFRELVASVRFDDGRETFVSDGYGYSMRIPAEWRVIPAVTPWAGTVAGERLDQFTTAAGGAKPRFTVGARAIDPGMTEEAWIDAYVPRIAEVNGPSCHFISLHVLAPPVDPDWHATTIDGRDALVRAACGKVDGVVIADGIGYWLRLDTADRRTGADVGAFDLFADTIDLDAVPGGLLATPSVGPGSKAFTSKRYGYSIVVPADWTVRSAPRRKPGEALHAGRTPDEFIEPGARAQPFTVMARELGGEVVDDTWLGTFVPEPIGAVASRTCRKPVWDGGTSTFHQGTTADWTESTVAGRPARIRERCGDVQAVIVVGDTAYVLWLATPTLPGVGISTFRGIADTFRIVP